MVSINLILTAHLNLTRAIIPIVLVLSTIPTLASSLHLSEVEHFNQDIRVAETLSLPNSETAAIDLTLGLDNDPLGKNSCSPWVLVKDAECNPTGPYRKMWKRDCHDETRSCKYHNRNLCDSERICLNQNPNLLNTVCSKWRRDNSTTCMNPVSGNWETRWDRVCVLEYMEQETCSKTPPIN